MTVDGGAVADGLYRFVIDWVFAGDDIREMNSIFRIGADCEAFLGRRSEIAI